ncbi:MAG: helix-turn-helix domain-containing protein [Oscillospiraceae bacterium]|nr:helix-turn-helix domain-containing protein [Oscillospiraceae bacterium]
MTFVEKLDDLIKQKGITRNQMLLEANLGRNSFVNWSNRESLPTGTAIVALAQYFNVSADYLLGLDTDSNQKNKISSGKKRISTHDRAYDFIKYRVGWEDAEFMFEAAEIPIEDSEYEMPTKVLKWIAAHCGVDVSCLTIQDEIEKCEFDGTPYYAQELENLEELLKDPDIEMLENKYLKAKCNKYAEISIKKLWKSDNKLQQEVIQGFMELINQFDGDIGSQFALLDRSRQAAKQLSEEVALRKERA